MTKEAVMLTAIVVSFGVGVLAGAVGMVLLVKVGVVNPSKVDGLR